MAALDAALQHASCAVPRRSPVVGRGLVCLVLVLCSAGCATRPQPEAGQVEAWITTSDRTQQFAPSVLRLRAAQGIDADIVVDASQRHQRMVGFGASITDASAWLIQTRMSAAQRDALLHELYGREGDGIGFDFARLTIGASDFSRFHYSLDDPPGGKPDPALRHFGLGPNRADVVPVARAALAINPGLKIMASPWSAPAWMKDSSHLVTGTLLPGHYDAYARYLLTYVDAMRDEGIPVFALTVQNEPDYEPKDYPGMRFNAPARARFIGDHLGPLRDARNPGLLIFDWDHNWDKPQEPLAVLADPAASKHVSAVAWHCYGGEVSAQSLVREAHPDKDVYMTECSGGDWEPVRSGGLTLQFRTLIIGTTRHWARGVLFWNLALDENNGPHAGGCDTCRGVVTIDSRTGKVTRTDDYYALAHASRFVHRDAWRIASNETGGGIDNVAFENADDASRVLLLSNSNAAARTVTVREGRHAFTATLPARSIASFRWMSDRE